MKAAGLIRSSSQPAETVVTTTVCGVANPQVMQRFADSVRVQALVQSERSLCYYLLLLALEVRQGPVDSKRKVIVLRAC